MLVCVLVCRCVDVSVLVYRCAGVCMLMAGVLACWCECADVQVW